MTGMLTYPDAMTQPASPHPSAELLHATDHALMSTYGAALPDRSEVVLFDYPAHTNVGDAAIWIGERLVLRRLGIKVIAAADLWNMDLSSIGKLVAGRTVLMHGGGSFGDMWPQHQVHREEIMRRCPASRIVQLAQTVHFADARARDASRRAYEAHGDVLVMARDQPSLQFLRRWFDVPSVLCPDAALALGDLRSRRRMPTQPVLTLGRTDREGAPGTSWPPAAVDWLEDDPSRLLARISRVQRMAQPYLSAGASRRSRLALYDEWAKKRLLRGLRTLGSGSVVATDRLHAHMLSLLLGIPHVLVDNSYGKLRGFVDTWTSGSTLTHWASDRPAAMALAERLAEQNSVR